MSESVSKSPCPPVVKPAKHAPHGNDVFSYMLRYSLFQLVSEGVLEQAASEPLRHSLLQRLAPVAQLAAQRPQNKISYATSIASSDAWATACRALRQSDGQITHRCHISATKAPRSGPCNRRSRATASDSPRPQRPAQASKCWPGGLGREERESLGRARGANALHGMGLDSSRQSPKVTSTPTTKYHTAQAHRTARAAVL